MMCASVALVCPAAEERVKNKSVRDGCQAFFDKYHYTFDYLYACGVNIYGIEKEIKPNTHLDKIKSWFG
jgi:hypothetical protein